MLADLDDVRWPKLTHAYGKASDVPDLLRGLTHASATKRKAALNQLSASICHQGTLYSATAPAIPFLLELLSAPKVKDKEALLELLASIATLDDPASFALDGMPAALTKLPKDFRSAVTAVRAGWKVYAELLGASDASVRGHAAFLLAWLPETARDAAPLVRRALAREKDKGVRAALCLSLGQLARLATSKKDENDSDDLTLFAKLLADKDAGMRAAAALATSHVKRGEVTPAVVDVLGASAKKRLRAAAVPWFGGDLALFATHVLAALPQTDATDEHLIAVLEGGGSGASLAASVVARRLFGPESSAKKAVRGAPPVARRDKEEDRELAAIATPLAELDVRQRRVLDALNADEEAFDADARKALGARGLPSTPSLLARYLEGSKPSTQSILDREVVVEGKKLTLGELYVKAAKPWDRPHADVVATLLAATSPEEQLELAMKGIVEVNVPWSAMVALELTWAAAPKCEKALEAVATEWTKGVRPKRATDTAVVEFPMATVAIGVGLASLALSRKRPAEPRVDAMLQEAYGFIPRVRDALAALPLARREAWVLDEKRDDRAQPAEHFKGGWPYWTAVPTKKIADHALAHVKTWKPKDPWGGHRTKFADPQLVALAQALRAAGNETDAARCEAALTGLGA